MLKGSAMRREEVQLQINGHFIKRKCRCKSNKEDRSGESHKKESRVRERKSGGERKEWGDGLAKQ